MRGVFGAGVATYIEESPLYGQISEICASSAGALTGAYLLTQQTRLGSSIFYVDLIEGFISIRNFWGGIADRIANHYLHKTPPKKVRDAINIDHLFRVVSGSKLLLKDKLRGHSIPLWIKVLELEPGVVRYFHIEEHDPIELLRASASLIPYVSTPVKLGDKYYVDAAIVDPIGYTELRRRYPTEKLVIVFNGDVGRKLKNVLKNKIEGKFAEMMYGKKYFDLFASADSRLQEELRQIQQDPRTLLLSCPTHALVSTRTRDAERLQKAYAAGIAAGPKIEEFLS